MVYDTVIIGGGPSGLTAGIYAARGGLKTLLLEKNYIGGQASITPIVENYPGFISISGIELTEKMREQAALCGVEFEYLEPCEFFLQNALKTIKIGDKIIKTKTVIFANGASPRKLDIPDEEKFVGRGVSYCATCDGALYKNKSVAVIGGGNTAIEDALYLQRFAKEVYLIHRREGFRASDILIKELRKSNVKLILNSVVKEIAGDKKVASLLIENTLSKVTHTMNIDGIFVAVGMVPDSASVPSEVIRDEQGYIVTDEEMSTNISGVYAVGDMRKKTIRQIVTACADGAIGAESANKFIMSND